MSAILEGPVTARPPAGELEPTRGRRFAVEIDPVMLYGASYASTGVQIPTVARVSRSQAMSVPAVKRGRDLIAGTLGTLPLKVIGPDNTVPTGNNAASARALFEQPEEDIPRSITLIRTFEDLLFEQVAWWKVTAYGWDSKPAKVVRLDPRSVTVGSDMRVYETLAGNSGMVQRWLPDEDLIRFDGPTDPLLVAGARAIRACLALDQAALKYSQGNQPLDWFTPTEGVDPADDDEIEDILSDWATARAAGVTGYVPAALNYHTAGWDPQKLQLAEARDHAVLELSRLMGIDPEDLGVSTTSRTYQNQQDRYQARIKDTLRQFVAAFEDRLSMADVTPRGYRARLDFSDLLRTDDATRMNVHKVALEIGAETREEMRRAEHKPPLTPAEAADLADIEAAPVDNKQEVSADA
jgi:HK97 family phage portal protein